MGAAAIPIAAAVAGSVVSAKLSKSGSSSGSSGQPASQEDIDEQIGNLPPIEIPPIEEFFAPLNISSPSFQFSGSGGNFDFSRTQPSIALDTFDRRIPEFFGTIDDLRSRFRPGFSELRDARMGATTAARQRGLSNLRDSLARRRVQGSSFARAERTQAEREFGQLEAEQQAQSFLEEAAANAQILELEQRGMGQLLNRAQVDLQEFQAALAAAGLSAQVGTARAGVDVQAQVAQLQEVGNIIRSLNGLSASNTAAQAQLDAANAAGIGNFAGLFTEALISGANRSEGVTTTSGAGQDFSFQPTTTGNFSING